MANTLKARRGLKASLPTLAAGEFGFCTDTGELFIGTGAGNTLIGGGSMPSAADIPLFKLALAVRTNAADPASRVDIAAAEIALENTAGQRVIRKAVSVTVDITATGAGGRDAGAEAASTLYYVWLIWNGSVVAGLLSTSAASPTMPGGYTHKRLVGEVFNDASSNFVRFDRRGDEVWFEDPQAVYNAALLAPSWEQKTLPAAIPAGCSKLIFEASTSAGSTNASQLISPDSTPRHEVYVNHFDASYQNVGPCAGYNPIQVQMRHRGAASIYARSGKDGYIAYQNLHAWGYEREV